MNYLAILLLGQVVLLSVMIYASHQTKQHVSLLEWLVCILWPVMIPLSAVAALADYAWRHT